MERSTISSALLSIGPMCVSPRTENPVRRQEKSNSMRFSLSSPASLESLKMTVDAAALACQEDVTQLGR
jgi:hypothetical protein